MSSIRDNIRLSVIYLSNMLPLDPSISQSIVITQWDDDGCDTVLAVEHLELSVTFESELPPQAVQSSSSQLVYYLPRDCYKHDCDHILRLVQLIFLLFMLMLTFQTRMTGYWMDHTNINLRGYRVLSSLSNFFKYRAAGAMWCTRILNYSVPVMTLGFTNWFVHISHQRLIQPKFM